MYLANVFFLALAATAPLLASCTLDSEAKANGLKYFGTATDQWTFKDTGVAKIIQSEFGMVTPENSMKWDSLQPQRGKFSWTNADALVQFASANRKQIRGHTLVWHSQLPSWVDAINDKATLRSVITTHINTVAGRYKGKIYAWDVVNEIFNEDGTFRNSVFYRVLGEEFITLAFTTANKADPTAKLYINDYNLESSPRKLNALNALVTKLVKAKVPIHGIGTQTHLQTGQSWIPTIQQSLQKMADTGVQEVAVTELEVKMVAGKTVAQQNKDYQSVAAACKKVKKCVGVTVWGVIDKQSWVSKTGTEVPLLFNNQYQKKDVYNGVVAGLRA